MNYTHTYNNVTIPYNISQYMSGSTILKLEIIKIQTIGTIIICKQILVCVISANEFHLILSIFIYSSYCNLLVGRYFYINFIIYEGYNTLVFYH
jgi:hypothetical protein